jgi:hypothetical protein
MLRRVRLGGSRGPPEPGGRAVKAPPVAGPGGRSAGVGHCQRESLKAVLAHCWAIPKAVYLPWIRIY